MDTSKASVLRTLSVRVRDKHAAILSRIAFEANQVWNAANEETATWCYIPVPEVGYIRNPISAFELQKTQLDYKSKGMRVVFLEVDEKYTTQTCSCCGSISSPKGRAGLRIREWTCAWCGTLHDRDINAARNILAAGHGRLAVGIPDL